MQGLISIEPYYQFSNNRISQIITPINDSLVEYSFDNAGNYENKGIKGNISIPFLKNSLIFQSSFDFYKSSISYLGKSHSVKDWSSEIQLIYINKKFSTIAGLNYQKGAKKLITTQGYNYNNTDFWLLFVQQPLLKNKMTIMLGYMLPIDFGANYEQGSYVDTDFYKSYTKYDISLLKNLLMFRITYRFNKGKSVKNIEKEIKKRK